MAARNESELGSLLLWGGVAYVAYQLYQASQVGSSAPSSTSGATASAYPGSSTATPAPSQSAGGTNPGGISLSSLFASGESGTVAQPLPVSAQAQYGNSGSSVTYSQPGAFTDSSMYHTSPEQAAIENQQINAIQANDPQESGAPWTAAQSAQFQQCTDIEGEALPGCVAH